MTQGFSGDKLISWLLSWFKYLFYDLSARLTGSGSGLMSYVMQRWYRVLITLVVIGTAVNILMYLIRWRPHWWWFAKKRMVVDDSLFVPRKKKSAKPTEKAAKKPSTIVKRESGEQNKDIFKVKKK